MKRLLICALLSASLGCASGDYCANLEPGNPWAASQCDKLTPLFSKWQASLGLRDWTIVYSCEKRQATDPDGNILLGEAYPSVTDRRAEIWISPEATDQEEIVVHELLHLVLTTAREADSELIEEQQVRVLTALLHKRAPSSPQGPASFVGRGTP